MNPYLRFIRSSRDRVTVRVDVYEVLQAYPTGSAALDHAAKKILCAGQRGAKSRLQDLEEARDAITRAIEMEGCNGSKDHAD